MNRRESAPPHQEASLVDDRQNRSDATREYDLIDHAENQGHAGHGTQAQGPIEILPVFSIHTKWLCHENFSQSALA